ncbi:MAG: hypothetical protein ACI8RZ_004392 [Myxococcota bacterium]|jgi:hypothetical protein
MTIEVPYAWVEEGIVTLTMQAQIQQYAGNLDEIVAWAGELPEGAVIPVPVTTGAGESVELVLLGRIEAPVARTVVLESWDADGVAAPETHLSLRTARMLLPVMRNVSVNGTDLLAPAESVLSLDRALENMQDRPPTVLFDATQASGRVRVSTR